MARVSAFPVKIELAVKYLVKTLRLVKRNVRIVLKSAEKDFVLSHAFSILPLMLWIMRLSSFDPKARILLRSSAICLLP